MSDEELDPTDDLPVRDVRADLEEDGENAGDPLSKLSQSLSRVAAELEVGSQTIEASRRARVAKKAEEEPQPEPKAEVTEPVAAPVADPPEQIEAAQPEPEAQPSGPAPVEAASDPEPVAEPASPAAPEDRTIVLDPPTEQFTEPIVLDDLPPPIDDAIATSQPDEPDAAASSPDEPTMVLSQEDPAPQSESRAVQIDEPWPSEPPKLSEPPSEIGELDTFVFAQNRDAVSPQPLPEPQAVATPPPATRERSSPRRGPQHLNRRRFAALVAFADALLPEGGELGIGGIEAGVAERVDAAIGRLDPDVRKRVEQLISLVDAAPLATRGRRLSKMSPESATAWIDKALNARNAVVRQAVSLLKVIVANEFASTPVVEQAIGFTYGCETRDPVRDAAALEVIAYPAVAGNHVEECDVVVVGSGAGGAAAAKECAEAGLNVIVVEEGAHFTRADFAGPPWERVQKLYRANGTTVALGRPLIPIPLGKAVGGTTLVNSGTCFRTPDRVLARWGSEFGIEGIDPQSMKPVFDRVERILHVQPIPEEVIGDNARVFRRGVHKLGLNGQPIARNISGCRGCGVCAFGCPSDAKQATHISYLPRAQRAGATIYARCAVDRVVVEGGRARGVVARILDQRGETKGSLTINARIIVLAAGALHTPALLERNALANRTGMLGRNLRIHPATGLGAIFDEPVFGWRGTLQSYYVDDWHDRDETMIEVTSSVPGVAAGSLPGAGIRLKSLMGRFPNIASAGLFVSDTSSGRVRRRRSGEPLVTYRLNEHDTVTMAAGMARIAEIFLAAGARAVYTGLPQIPWVTSVEEVSQMRETAVKPSNLKLTAFHPVGTARMGADPQTTVVNPWGECHDVEGLFVADASVLPGCPTVNPQVTIMAFATRTAAHLVRDRAPSLV